MIIETKFNVKQKVIILCDDTHMQGVVTDIEYKKGAIWYCIEVVASSEEMIVFPALRIEKDVFEDIEHLATQLKIEGFE